MLVYSAYVLMAVFWLSRYLSGRWTEALHAARTISGGKIGGSKFDAGEIEVGEHVQIQLRLDNRDSWSILWVLIDDLICPQALVGPPPALQVDGERLRICSVPAKSSRVLSYRVTALRRGYYQIGPTIAETGDLLGLHRRFRALETTDYLLVLPKLIPLAGYDIASR
ncbi:MAG: DUF58 domain-containing protein, partial [Aureliella sp.]